MSGLDWTGLKKKKQAGQVIESNKNLKRTAEVVLSLQYTKTKKSLSC